MGYNFLGRELQGIELHREPQKYEESPTQLQLSTGQNTQENSKTYGFQKIKNKNKKNLKKLKKKIYGFHGCNQL